MAKIDRLPVDDNTNGWSRILPHRDPKPPIDGDIRADWVVVGAGWAGLGAARRLAENRPNDKIVLLEANEVGEGASGRNSGFAIDLPHATSGSLDELSASRQYMALARAAISHLDEQISRHDIECDWSMPGKYQAAVSEKGVKTLIEPFVKELDALGEPYRWVHGDELARELGTSHFLAAVHTPGCRLMNPAALTRGLGDSLPQNVAFHEHSPVVEVDYQNGVTLTTPKGSVYAPQMIIAVNGFANRFGFFKNSLLPFAAHASLSRQLNDKERRDLGCVDNWGLTPGNAFAGITMRFTQDHRLLIRQDIRYCPGQRSSDAERAVIGKNHKALFDARFPMLPDVEMEYTWTGFVAMSRNGSPGFGRVAPNVYAAVCQNAIGVTKGTISGILAADLACGQDNPLIAYMEGLGSPDKLPPQPFLDIGVRAKLAWDLWAGRAER
jgi:glycine/D-amino acid oxidase-like deaminating enzyme